MRPSRVATGMLGLLLAGLPARATEDFAAETGQSCAVCHDVTFDGARLTDAGKAFEAGGYVWPVADAPGGLRSLAWLRFVAGLVHVVFAFTWVGTILYIHLVLRPKYVTGGLPGTEVRLAWLSIVVLGVTGAVLTWFRFGSWQGLTGTRAGVLLLHKLGLYLFLVLSAGFVTVFLSPRLKRLARGWQSNDGQGGRPAWVKVGDAIHDLSASPHWKEGVHFQRHRAGRDLTGDLEGAPHGAEKLAGFRAWPAQGGQERFRKPVLRTLYVMAYVNLVVALGVLVVIALWRWG